MRIRSIRLIGVAAAATMLASVSLAHGATQRGVVRSVEGGVPFAKVTIYRAGDTPGGGEVPLGFGVADGDGEFEVGFVPPPDPGAVLYLIAEGATEATRLATVLGGSGIPDEVTVNERTTVATAYTMAQFIDGASIGGNAVGVRNAASIFRNLVDLETGDVGDVLGSAPNGSETNTMALFNSLANLVASCVLHQACDSLFVLTTPPGGTPPENTLDAMVNLAHRPWRNATELFTITPDVKIYEPALTLPPVTWTLALLYEGNGRMFDGPGAIAFDAEGTAWINNNYTYRRNHNAPSCGSDMFFNLMPNGDNAPGSPFNGKKAGVSGAGFGICLDPDGDIWIGNFGFFGSTCPCKRAPLANSVSKVAPDGSPLSPPTGFTQGCVAGPQATVSDQDGSIWIANACGGTVTRYNAGNPNDFWVFDLNSLALVASCPTWQGNKPFGIAIDHEGNGWVTDNGTSTTIKLSPEGELLAYVGAEAGIDHPMGNATDSAGGVWISNSHVVHVPCVTCSSGDSDAQDYGDLDVGLIDPSITHLDHEGNLLGVYTGGGLWIPWGIAVDGDDNVWVANFGGKRVSAFTSEGEPIAPLGYYSDAMERITGVSIDPSGNVWLANNWLIEPPLTNPGGDGVLVFIGLAAPVKTPMFGPPEKP